MDNWKDKIEQGDIKVNVLGDVTGKTLIFTIPVGTPDNDTETFQQIMEESFPEAKEILIMKGNVIEKIDIFG